MLKKLFSHTAIYGLAPQIPKIASFLALPIITKDLDAVDYGVYGTVLAYTTAFSVLSLLGLRLILVNSFYHYPGQHKWLWKQVYGFLNLWNLFFGFFIGLVLFYIIPKEAQENLWLIVLLNVIPIIFFGATSTMGFTYYQLKQKPIHVALRSAIFGFLGVACNVFFISYLKLGYMGWFWSLFIVAILNSISYWYPLHFILGLKPIYNFKWRLIKKSLKVSLPIIPHHYSNYLLDSSDKVIMDLKNVSTADIGKYNAAYSIGNLFSSLSIAAGNAITPLMNDRYKNNDDIGARKLIFNLQVLFITLTTISSIWMKEFFYLMINNDVLNKVYPIAIIIIMSYNYRPLYLGFVSKFFYLEETSYLWKHTFTSGLINVLLNFVFIPIFGFEAAAYTTFFAFMYMGFVGFSLKFYKKIKSVEYYPIYWFISIVSLTIISYFVVEFNVVSKIIISIFILFTSGVFFYFLNRNK
jgi:O-antigen/teichoic acid export membrane protein